MKLGFLFCVCAALLLGGCNLSASEEKREVFNKQWEPEVALENEHLLVNWADIEGTTPPRGALSLKVPRAYLDSQFGGRDDKGKLDRLYFELMLPDGAPFPPIPKYPNRTEEEQNRIKEMATKRVFVVLYRDTLSQAKESIHRRKYTVGGAGRNIFPDGEVDGLEKYSVMICLSDHETSPPAYKAMVQANLAVKTADDSSPPGCYRNTHHFILVASEAAKQVEPVFANCWNDTCWFHFNIANRTAELTVGMSDVGRWREQVEVAQRVLSRFVISSNP